MKATFRLSALTVVAFALPFIVFRTQILRPQTLPSRPFVATVLETGHHPDGTIAFETNSVHAVKRDGSQVDMFRLRLPDGQWEYPRKILNVSTALEITIEPATKTVSSKPMSKLQLGWLTSSATNCGAPPGAPVKSILGYSAVLWSAEQELKEQQSWRGQEWRAPTLGCYPLSQRAELGPKGGPSPYTVREVLFVLEGDPPSSLFDVQSSLTERSPSEMSAEFERIFSGKQLFRDPAKLDRQYYSRRSGSESNK